MGGRVAGRTLGWWMENGSYNGWMAGRAVEKGAGPKGVGLEVLSVGPSN